MAITLTELDQPARFVYYGDADNVPITAGQSLKIETTPRGEEVLDWECPAGQTWSARIIVELERQ